MKTILLVIFMCYAAGVDSSGQIPPSPADLRVRLLDYKTGHPVEGRHIVLTLADANGHWAPEAVGLKEKTGADGSAAFRFSSEAAQRILVVAIDDFACTEPGPKGFATDEIIKHGIVGNLIEVPFCKHHISTLPDPRPGELVFYVHSLNFWERIRRRLQE